MVSLVEIALEKLSRNESALAFCPADPADQGHRRQSTSPDGLYISARPTNTWNS